MEMDCLPRKHQLQHPYPHTPAYERKGREMLKDLSAAFQDGKESLLLRSDLYPSSAVLEKAKKRKKSTEPQLAVAKKHLKRLEREKTAIYGKRRIDSKKVWLMDFSKIESTVQQGLAKSEKAFRRIEMTFKLYNNLTKLPSLSVPPLNSTTQVALSLWLFKNSSGSGANDELQTHFKALLHLVQGCVKGNFCPSFFMPSYNTMAPKAAETNPMGVVALDELFSDTDSDESEVDELTEETEAPHAAGDKTNQHVKQIDNQGGVTEASSNQGGATEASSGNQGGATETPETPLKPGPVKEEDPKLHSKKTKERWSLGMQQSFS